MKNANKKRWLRFLKFRCSGCAVCCTEPVVPVTHQDVARIMNANGHTAKEIVRFFDADEVLADRRIPLWVELRQGRRLMGLRKQRGRCLFLQRGRCQIYPHRPVTCRLFPFNVYLDSTRQVESMEINDAVKCDYSLDGKNTLRAVQALYFRDEKQDETYFAKVRRWNAERPNGTAQEFLVFLGLEKNLL
jgi:Fe-S-cluster containining protein